MTNPVIEAGDTTLTYNNSTNATFTVTYPSYVSGDLLIILGAMGGNANLTHGTLPSGPQSETLNSLESGYVGSTANSWPSCYGLYWVGGSTDAGGTITITPSAAARHFSTCIKVPSGEFNASTPIDSVYGYWSSGAGASQLLSGASWTTSSGVVDGTVLELLASDTGITAIATPATGWTTLQEQDVLGMFGAFVVRDASIAASTLITQDTWTTTGSDNDRCSFGVVVDGVTAGGGPDINYDYTLSIS